MNFNQLFNIFNNQSFIPIVFKVLAVFLSIFYLFYSVVILKQTQVMNKVLKVERNQLFIIVAALQIVAALIIIFLAVFLV